MCISVALFLEAPRGGSSGSPSSASLRRIVETIDTAFVDLYQQLSQLPNDHTSFDCT